MRVAVAGLVAVIEIDEEAREGRIVGQHFLDEDEAAAGGDAVVDAAKECLALQRPDELQREREDDDVARLEGDLFVDVKPQPLDRGGQRGGVRLLIGAVEHWLRGVDADEARVAAGQRACEGNERRTGGAAEVVDHR